jgi:hypothetical protein
MRRNAWPSHGHRGSRTLGDSATMGRMRSARHVTPAMHGRWAAVALSPDAVAWAIASRRFCALRYPKIVRQLCRDPLVPLGRWMHGGFGQGQPWVWPVD